MDTIQRQLDYLVSMGAVKGAGILITREGEEVYYGQSGHSDAESGRPFARDTLMHIYSMTKPVTAVTLLTLMEQGAFRLDDPISLYIPEFAATPVAVQDGDGVKLKKARRCPSFRDLFTMCSGVTYYSHDGDPVSEHIANEYSAALKQANESERAGEGWSTLQMCRALAGVPLAFQPGARWHYGMSCDVLGALAVAITGMEFGDYMRRAVLSPLGMEDTFFRVPDEKRGRLAKLYVEGPKGLTPFIRSKGVEMIDNRRIEMGGAGLISTVDDYTRFLLMLLGGGELDGVRVLKPETVRLMTTDHLTPQQMTTYNWPALRGYGYGFNVRVMRDPAQAMFNEHPGSFGWNGAACTSMLVDPVRRTTVVYGSQRLPGNNQLYLPMVYGSIADHFGYPAFE